MIAVRGLVKQFGDKRILDGIDLEIAKGEIVAIMGSSGGGKTTLLRCIAGLAPASSGSVTVDGIDVAKSPEEARHRMGMVFQNAALFDYMSVADNVAFGIRRHLRLGGSELTDSVHRALDRVGLTEDDARKLPADLSGGMRKRAGIARAIAIAPRVMLYDEPTTGLDPITTYTIDGLIHHLRADLELTSLVVSHDLTSVFRTADRIAFLESGRLSFLGTAAEFRASRVDAIQELLAASQAESLKNPTAN